MNPPAWTCRKELAFQRSESRLFQRPVTRAPGSALPLDRYGGRGALDGSSGAPFPSNTGRGRGRPPLPDPVAPRRALLAQKITEHTPGRVARGVVEDVTA